MEIIVLSRLFAEEIVPDMDIRHAVISITTPENLKPAEFKLNEYLKEVLYIKCYDIDFSDGNVTPIRAAILEKYGHGLFTDTQAKEVTDFVIKVKDSVEVIVCHCDAGISRSAGVGAAISLILNGSDKDIFNDKRYRPNMYMYRKILDNYYNRKETKDDE